MRAQAVELATEQRISHPPIRLRTILLFGMLLLFGYKMYPRTVAAWELHSLATTLADYALCMVGPTGPSLIRDNPDEFALLVRRRLIASPSEEAPFAECAPLAREITASEIAFEAHQARAVEFQGYGSGADGGAVLHTLGQLRVTTEPLSEMSRRAWPFIRGGYTRLVKPSLGAVEAVHPVAPPAPAVGSGLPNWRARYRAVHKTQTGFLVAFGQGANLSVYETADDGVSFKPIAPRNVPSDFLERCPIDADGRSFTFSLSDDAAFTIVNSLGPDGAPYAATLASSEQKVMAAACDSEGLVAALATGHGRSTTLMLCPFRRACAPMQLPVLGSLSKRISDVGRIRGTTVVAVSDAGIVRITSSRDGGRTWAPLSVAFDAGEHQQAAMGLPAPDRLLGLDERLLLYGGGERAEQAYLVLVSDDHGASWRTP